MLPPQAVDKRSLHRLAPGRRSGRRVPAAGRRHQPRHARLARLVFAAFQLAAQANLTETERQSTPRQERRRAQRTGLPDCDVQIVRLRRSVAADRDAEQADAGRGRHRWVVRSHWRNHWYPSILDHRPLWIAHISMGRSTPRCSAAKRSP
jgi:hypothetical protein